MLYSLAALRRAYLWFGLKVLSGMPMISDRCPRLRVISCFIDNNTHCLIKSLSKYHVRIITKFILNRIQILKK